MHRSARRDYERRATLHGQIREVRGEIACRETNNRVTVLVA